MIVNPSVLNRGHDYTRSAFFGYGYQWWIPESDKGEFLALGIYGQMIYVNPADEIIIVNTKADPHFQDDDFKADAQSLEAFRAIVRSMSGGPG